MRLSMSFKSRRELLEQVGPRYREANRKQKAIILDEFIASTGYARKYAIRLLALPVIPSIKEIKRPRSPHYGIEVQEALRVAWAAANFIGSKRLAPFLEELVPSLERHGHLKLSEEVRTQLLSISPATIDRILRPLRVNGHPRGINTTKSGTLLKHQIPVRTFADWEEIKPGFFKADLVAHCGSSMEGSFLYTLVLTDISTGWVECLPLPYRSQHAVIEALEHARQLLPFPMVGLDTDNGSEFINNELLTYCEHEEITFTRGRTCKKNDQCYVEQKNGAVVRQFIGYDRFEGERAYRQLTEVYRAVRLYINFFQPSVKLLKKERKGSKVRRIYDAAHTPFQRLSTSEVLCREKLDRLRAIYTALDPVRLLQQIQTLQDALWQHAVLQETTETDREVKPEVHFEAGTCGLSEDSERVSGNSLIDPETRDKRKYRRTPKPKVHHWWRTRQDPFEEVWDEICKWLKDNPERTAKSLLKELQERYCGQYKDNQLRTLQRRVRDWRAKAIITFNDKWLQEDALSKESLSNKLEVTIEEEGEKAIEPGIAH
jgi:hypothetical protein